jgi:hypothetical protein
MLCKHCVVLFVRRKHDGSVPVKIVFRMFRTINANLSVTINPTDILSLIFTIPFFLRNKNYYYLCAL